MAVWTLIQLSDIRSGFRIDSEFYKNEYIQKDRDLLKLKCSSLGHLAKVTDGEHGSVNFVGSGIKYLTAENVKQGYIDFEKVRFVGLEVDKRNARASVNVGDILISIKGTLGEVGVAEMQLLPANMNRDVAIIKPFLFAPSGHYIAAFLRSSYGAYQLAREGSGGVQQMITLERLRGIKIPLVSDFGVNLVTYEYKQAQIKRQESIDLYTQSQKLIESEMGLDQLHFDKPVGYTAQFSDLEISHRNDAQHYQPRFTQLLEHLEQFPTKRVREICLYNRRGIQPIYSNKGTHPVINSQHLGEKHINYDGLQKTTEYFFNASPEAHIQKDDLLIYTTGAYVGRTNVYLDDTPAFASNHVNILRLSSQIDHAYMAMVLQSIIGQFQTQKHARGSAQAELYPADINKFVVPLLSHEKQAEIGNLVRESLVKKRESFQLLEQAKFRVEQLIEEAVKE